MIPLSSIIQHRTNLKLNFQLSIWKKAFSDRKNIGVIGVPFWYGQPKFGTNHAPDHLRSNGLIQKLQTIFTQNQIKSKNVIDFGNLHLETENLQSVNRDKIQTINNPNEYNLWKMLNRCSRFVRDLIQNDYCALVLGGDHSVAIGSVIGSYQANLSMFNPNERQLSLIWIDAHADANNVDNSRSGNFHGMPISYLIRKDSKCSAMEHLFGQIIKPCLPSNNIVYIGLRDVEWQEWQLLKEWKIAFYSMAHVDKLGINEVVARALDHVDPMNKNNVHVSFDVDSLDPSVMPSTGTPVHGGLTLRETLNIAEEIHRQQQNRMICLDVVEFNPHLSIDSHTAQQSAQQIIHIIMAFLGKSRLGYFPIEQNNASID